MIPAKPINRQTQKAWNTNREFIQTVNQNNPIFFTTSEGQSDLFRKVKPYPTSDHTQEGSSQKEHLTDKSIAKDQYSFINTKKLDDFTLENSLLSQEHLRDESIKPPWQKMLEIGRAYFNIGSYTKAAIYFTSLLDNYYNYITTSVKKEATHILEICETIEKITAKIKKLKYSLTTKKDYIIAKKISNKILFGKKYQNLFYFEPAIKNHIYEKILPFRKIIQRREQAEGIIQKAKNYSRHKNYDLARIYFRRVLEGYKDILFADEINTLEENNITCTKQIALKTIRLGDKIYSEYNLEKSLEYYSQALIDYGNILPDNKKLELENKIDFIFSQLPI